MGFQDRNIECSDCNQEFVFTAGEQEFYASKEFKHDPKRCPNCRYNRSHKHGTKELFPAICSSCGRETQVPFKPTEGRPVYCTSCFTRTSDFTDKG